MVNYLHTNNYNALFCVFLSKSNQIKSLLLSHHHSTSALVSEILMSMLQTVQKTTDNLPMDRQCKKKNRQFTYGQTVQKNCTGAFTVLQTVQKNNNSNLHMDRQCKKATAIYIWTVHIYRLYRRQCAKYTYIYSVHIVYYKDILNYQRHQDKKTMSSSEDEVDSLFEESMVGRINSLEKFAADFKS